MPMLRVCCVIAAKGEKPNLHVEVDLRVRPSDHTLERRNHGKKSQHNNNIAGGHDEPATDTVQLALVSCGSPYIILRGESK